MVWQYTTNIILNSNSFIVGVGTGGWELKGKGDESLQEAAKRGQEVGFPNAGTRRNSEIFLAILHNISQ